MVGVPTPRPRALLVAAGLSVVIAGCTGDDDQSAATTEVPAEVPVTVDTSDARSADNDGVLRLGMLLPVTGDGAQIGAPLRVAVMTAVEEINVAGGVFGSPIELISADEGDSPASVRSAAAALIDQNADAVIGPASSRLALEALGDLVEAGVLTCSPTASALSLDRYPDNGLFFRTIPSDRLQAAAIAQVASQTGANTATVVYLDDDFGRPLGQLVAGNLESGGLTVSGTIPFIADDVTFADEVDQIVESDPEVVVIVASAAAGGRLLSAMADSAIADDAIPIVVNGAMRHPVPADVVANLPATMRADLRGATQLARTIDSTIEPKGAFATNAQDCVNLIALAALQAGSLAATDIAEQIPAVSYNGTPCTTFVSCLQFVERNSNIDYNGLGGTLDLDTDGETSRGRFDVFGFDSSGVDESERQFVVTA